MLMEEGGSMAFQARRDCFGMLPLDNSMLSPPLPVPSPPPPDDMRLVFEEAIIRAAIIPEGLSTPSLEVSSIPLLKLSNSCTSANVLRATLALASPPPILLLPPPVPSSPPALLVEAAAEAGNGGCMFRLTATSAAMGAVRLRPPEVSIMWSPGGGGDPGRFPSVPVLRVSAGTAASLVDVELVPSASGAVPPSSSLAKMSGNGDAVEFMVAAAAQEVTASSPVATADFVVLRWIGGSGGGVSSHRESPLKLPCDFRKLSMLGVRMGCVNVQDDLRCMQHLHVHA